MDSQDYHFDNHLHAMYEKRGKGSEKQQPARKTKNEGSPVYSRRHSTKGRKLVSGNVNYHRGSNGVKTKKGDIIWLITRDGKKVRGQKHVLVQKVL